MLDRMLQGQENLLYAEYGLWVTNRYFKKTTSSAILNRWWANSKSSHHWWNYM